MNIKKIILVFVVLVMLVGGCILLDMDLVSDIIDLNYWKILEQFDLFVFGLYSCFRSYLWNMFLLGEVRSDVFGGIFFGGEVIQGMECFFYNILNVENFGISGFGDLYQNINQMNLFISRIFYMDVLIESVRNYYLGQVYGLCVYYMYQLYCLWGDVVFMEEFSLGFEVGKLVKVVILVVEIFEQVKKDIEFLLSYFGFDYIIKEKKLLWLKVVILMLKVDVYLWSVYCDGGEGDVWIVKNVLVDIQNNISCSNLDLMDIYQGVFVYDNKGNKEIIFIIYNELFEYNLWNGNNDLFLQVDYLGKFYNVDGILINMLVENNFGIMCLMVKLENFKKFLLGDICCDVILKDVYNKVENGKLELVGVYLYKYWGVMNGSIWVRCDDYFIYRYLDLLLMLVEVKVFLGEDLVIEINWVCWCVFGDVYDVLIVGFFNQEVDKCLVDVVLQECLFEFMLEGK